MPEFDLGATTPTHVTILALDRTMASTVTGPMDVFEYQKHHKDKDLPYLTPASVQMYVPYSPLEVDFSHC